MCSCILLVNSRHACVTYRRHRLTGTAAWVPNTVVYRHPQGSQCLWQAELSLIFVSVGSRMCPAFFAMYYWGLGVGRRVDPEQEGVHFLKHFIMHLCSPLWNWTGCLWKGFKWQLSVRKLLSCYEIILQFCILICYKRAKTIHSFIS